MSLLEINGRSILSLHVELEQWEDAFAIKRLHPEIEDDVTLPYAQWLINHDRYDHARLAYSHAGRPDLAERLLTQLMDNAVSAYIAEVYSISARHAICLDLCMLYFMSMNRSILRINLFFVRSSVEGEEVQGWSASMQEVGIRSPGTGSRGCEI